MDQPFKFVFRTAHLLSASFLCGSIVYNYISEGEMHERLKNHPSYDSFNTITSVMVFATGITNIFLTKDGKVLEDPIHCMWQHFFELKFILSLFLTPMIYPMTVMFAEEGEEFISENFKSKIQFWLVVFMCIYSSFIRYFREEVCQEFKIDAIM